MPDYAVKITFKSKDAFSSGMKAMGSNVQAFEGQAKRSFGAASKAASRFKGVLSGILVARTIQYSIGAISRGLRGLVTDFADFDLAATGATARFADIGPRAKDFDSQLKRIKMAARDAGAATIYTAAEAAKGLDFMARAGVRSSVAIGALPSAINLAAAAGEDFNATTDRSLKLMGAFQLNSKNEAQQIINYARLNDVLAAGVNKAQVTVEDLFETMKQAGPIATTLGYDLESTTAAGLALAKSGLVGTVGATALKNSMLRLVNPRVLKMLRANKVAIADAAGEALPFSKILQNLGDKLKGLGSLKRTQILSQIFGRYAVAGATGLIKNLSMMNEFEDELRQVTGTSQMMMERMLQSWPYKLRLIKSALVETGFQIIDAFEYKGKRGIDALTTAIRKFDTKPVIEGLRTAGMWLGRLYDTVMWLKPALPYIVAYFVAFKTVSEALFIGSIAKDFILLTSAAYKTGGAFALLNATMWANPAVWIAAAIIAVGAALYFIEKKTGAVSRTWQQLVYMFKVGVSVTKKLLLGLATKMMDVLMWVVKWGLKAARVMGGWLGFDTSGVTQMLDDLKEAKRIIDDSYKEVSWMPKAEIQAAQMQMQVSHKQYAAPMGMQPSHKQYTAPNRKDVEAQKAMFHGRLDIYGAPEGSTVKSGGGGAPSIDMRLMGVNP